MPGPFVRIGLMDKTSLEQAFQSAINSDFVKSLLAEEKPLSKQARSAIGYAEIIEHLNGRISLEDAIELIKKNTRRFAKNQRTWFKTFQNLHWLDIKPDEPPEKILNRTKVLLNETSA